jgi:Electron transfer DM13
MNTSATQPTRRPSLMSWCASLLCAALLAACGGSEPTPTNATQAQAEQAPRARALIAAPPVIPLDFNTLFDWAEATYPTLFPGAKPNLKLPPYDYRHYPETGNYVGVAGEDVYILGPVSNNELRRVGSLEDFRCRVLPSSCLKPYARAGWSAPLSTLQHGVRGTATIIDERTVRITGFYYDGGGPRVYAYLGSNNTNAAFTNGRIIGPLLQSRPYVNETVELKLPEGQSLDGSSALSIWCVEFRVNFGSGTFTAPLE